jgi:hypothetical protein
MKYLKSFENSENLDKLHAELTTGLMKELLTELDDTEDIDVSYFTEKKTTEAHIYVHSAPNLNGYYSVHDCHLFYENLDKYKNLFSMCERIIKKLHADGYRASFRFTDTIVITVSWS